MHKNGVGRYRTWTINETTENDMITIMHRLKRLIESFYHQKRIDIIITDNAHYVRNGGAWESSDISQEMIVFAHSKVIRPSSNTINPVLYSSDELRTLAQEHGITGNLNTPCISAMNGDWNTTSIWIKGVMRQNNTILLDLSSTLNANTPLRVSSLIGFAR